MGNRGLVRVLEKNSISLLFYHNPLQYGMALALSILALLT